MRALLLGGAAVVAALGPAPAAERWLKASSPHFELFTTAGAKPAREAIAHFETVRAIFAHAAPATGALSGRVRIVAFRSEKEFAPYRLNAFTSAYYVAAGGRDCIVMGGIAAEDYPTAVHEYTHFILNHVGLGSRLWLSEGLAEVYSSMTAFGDKVRLGYPIPRWVAALASEGWFPLAQLNTITGERARIFYAQSWALAHMLTLSPEYQPNAGRFLRAMAAGASDAAAFREAFGKPVSEVQADLQHYVKAGQFPTAIFSANLDAPVSVQVAPADALETGLALAELLAATRKPDAAEAYAALAREHPDRWEPEVALAHLESGRACLHYGRAVKLASDDADTWFEYATRCQPPDKAAVLAKALELRPEFTEARLQLAFDLLNAGQYTAVVEHLAKIRTIAHQHAAPYYRALALAHMKLGHEAECRRAAESARKFARTSAEAEEAERMMGYKAP